MQVLIPLWVLLLMLAVAGTVGCVFALLGSRKTFARLRKDNLHLMHRDATAAMVLYKIEFNGEHREGYSGEMLPTCPYCGHAPAAGHHATCMLYQYVVNPQYTLESEKN